MTRHPWYSPTHWVSELLFAIAVRMPASNDNSDIIVAGIWGAVEVCGLRRLAKPLFHILQLQLKEKLRRVQRHNQ